MTRALLIVPLFLLLTACGDDEPGGGGSGGASSSTGSPSSSTGASGATGGTGGSGASGGAGGAGGGACDILQAEPSLGTVTFRVKNDGDRTVYLAGAGECTHSFTITAPGIDTETPEILPLADVACEEVSPTYQGGFPADCLEVESGITLDPGEEQTFEWAGLLRESITVPDACAPPNESGAFCQRGLTAPGGPLTVHFPRYETLFVDEDEGTQYPTDELPQADVEFTHPTPEVIVDVSLYNDG